MAKYPDLMRCLSNSLRGVIVAPPGKKLVVSDLSNIEGRVLPWLAGEEWKLQAFRDFDAGTGPDTYKMAYASAFGIRPEEVTPDQRQIGKTMELALQFEGGVGAFLTMSHVTGLDLEAMSKACLPLIPKDVIEEAKKAWDWAKRKNMTLALPMYIYVACDSLKRLWRRRHPEITALWGELKEAIFHVVECKSGAFRQVRKLKVQRDGKWLRVVMPSENSICYPSPRVDRGKFSYMGFSLGKWKRIYSYGGKTAEQATQSTARDILAFSAPEIERAGYLPILSAHDEWITETPDESKYNVVELSKMMTRPPVFASDLPLAAKGFEAYRYRKD